MSSTLEIPKGGQGNTKVCSKVGVTEPERTCSLECTSPSMLHKAGGRATLILPPLIPTHREVPDGSSRVTGTTNHPLTSCSHLRPHLGEEFTQQVTQPAEVWPPPLTPELGLDPSDPHSAHLWHDSFLLLEDQESPTLGSERLPVCVCPKCVTPGTAAAQMSK